MSAKRTGEAMQGTPHKSEDPLHAAQSKARHLDFPHESHFSLFTSTSISTSTVKTLYSRWENQANWSRFASLAFAGLPSILRFPVSTLVRRLVRKQLAGQKTGRHSFETVLRLSDRAFDALSVQLGSKRYLFSDEKPSSIDASAFAHLSNILYVALPDDRLRELLSTKANLVKYCERMRRDVFPERVV
ncbi:hypothetical protein HKX48_007515 [Thoreauomyces humboldtii]|nr:hypothetical protein HKX48_007515 [Thoreauomyces humboldtii]